MPDKHGNQKTACDIILPVYNGLTYVKEALSSILRCSGDCNYRLFIIDDGSDEKTFAYLTEQAEKHPEIILHRNQKNLGFVKTCNLGIQVSSAPYLVLMNSDVIVTPHWLPRLVDCAESDIRIASVNPLTNYASNINIPIAPGANFYGMDMALSEHSPRSYPDVVTGVGFCMLLRRSALIEVGVFDEVFGAGYCEDSDLCMRLTRRGYRTVVADNVYVYHKGRSSFADRDASYFHNRKIFDQLWLDDYKRQFRDYQKADPLKPSRDLFQLPEQWDPLSGMRETYRSMRNCLRKKKYAGAVLAALRGIKQLPASKRITPSPDNIAAYTRPGRLRVTYVLHNLAVAGGVLSVVQLVNELILLGVEARIVALREYPEIYNWKFYSSPIIYTSARELIENFPETDIAVATHWTTAPWVAEAVKTGKAGKGVYFIQDFESWFFPESDHRSRSLVKETYHLIPNKIVKSAWLQNLLLKEGFPSVKIHLGMDLGIFYPREVSPNSCPVILAMARPRTPVRGFPFIVDALRLVKKEKPHCHIVFFGDDLAKQEIPFPYQDAGVVTDQNYLANLYSAADVYLDGSHFQGFGRPALEAMACGTASVLTGVGGVTEYARHEDNCLLVQPGETVEFARAILRVLTDEALKQKLITGGMKTSMQFCHKREAQETLEYFLTLHETGGHNG